MQQQNFISRSVFPVVLVLAIAIISFFGYSGSRSIENDKIRAVVALIFGTTYFISIALGPFYVYTLGYIKGSLLKERILASSLTPFLWMTKEVLRLTHSHPFLESLYWYLSPLHLWLIMLMGLEMGAATLIARKILKNRGDTKIVISLAPLIVMGVSLFLVIGAYAWGKGENLYVMFLEGYRILFGSGLS